ncbi:hypothetical protein [Natrinema pallidum]|uniref:Uncharacterized protein n=1 Tax=Natrinema pallidum TaxID=69527 RepID=A0A4P9TJW4_9EURY|nr:hypothetical protein [Natrinema pallidum]QCW05298.1 hypothetical protein FGF80_18835 [Natrinema pallidum]
MTDDTDHPARDSLHRHTRQIKAEYPDPLCYLLIELAEYNRGKWLEPPMDGTIGAENVRETGLTSNQQEWAATLADALEGADSE